MFKTLQALKDNFVHTLQIWLENAQILLDLAP